MLNSYLTTTRNLLNDTNPSERLFSDAVLTANINAARAKVAAMGQCVRFLPPTSAGFSSIAIANAGSGYGATPTVTISPPDQIPGIQATAVATMSGGMVTGVQLTEPGTGYFANPSVSFSSSAAGATALASGVLGFINCTQLNQEIYPFSNVTLQSGMAQILAVRGLSVVWGQYRFSPMLVSFSRYQAQYRNYNPSVVGTPVVVAQFGQGVSGTLYACPMPDQRYQMEWDCIILPVNLITDSTPEVIPPPWQFCVPYFAAFLTLDGAGRYSDAEKMMQRFSMFMKDARAESQVGQVSSWYGRAPS